MTNDLKHHEKYKELSRHIYYIDKEPAPKGTVPLYVHKNKENGFFGCAYKYEDRIVVVFRGTEGLNKDDLKTDIGMWRNKIPPQAKDAIFFTEQMKEVIKKHYPGYKLDLTGHSLGGSLSQYVHVLVEGVNKTVTFHPYGTSDTLERYLFENKPANPVDNITNYYDKNDKISGIFSKHTQLGKCYEVGIKDAAKKSNDVFKHHKIENMKPLSTRVEVKQIKSIQSQAGNIYRKGIEQIKKIKDKGFEKVKDKLHISYIQDVDCVGSYPVSGYIRSDGTKVEGYTRTCGAKHNGMSSEVRRAGQEKYKGKRFQDIPLDELETAIGYFI